jgi:hypothetical protein
MPEKDGRLHASVRSETLRTALDRMVTTKTEPGALFAFRHGGLTLSSRAKESGQSKIAIPLAFNDTVDLIFDVPLMQDYLRSLDADAVVNIFMLRENDPVLFETDGGDYRYLVMPMAKPEVKANADVETEIAEPEADTGDEVVGQVSTMEEPMKEVYESPCSDADTDLETKMLRLVSENDCLHAKAEQYKMLLDRAMRVIERMKNERRVCV